MWCGALQSKLLGDAVPTPVRADSGRYLYDHVTLVLQLSPADALVVHAHVHRSVGRGSHRLRPAAVAAPLAAVLGRFRQTWHASPAPAHQLSTVLHVVWSSVWQRMPRTACRRLPTADPRRLGAPATCCRQEQEVYHTDWWWWWWISSGRGTGQRGRWCDQTDAHLPWWWWWW